MKIDGLSEIRNMLWKISDFSEILYADNPIVKGMYGDLIAEVCDLNDTMQDRIRCIDCGSLPYVEGVQWPEVAGSLLVEDLSQTVISNCYSNDPEKLEELHKERDDAIAKLTKEQMQTLLISVMKYLDDCHDLLGAYIFVKGIVEHLSEDHSLTSLTGLAD